MRRGNNEKIKSAGNKNIKRKESIIVDKKSSKENKINNANKQNMKEDVTEEKLNKGIEIVKEYKEKKEAQRKKRLLEYKKVDKKQQSKISASFTTIALILLAIIMFFAIELFIEYAPILGINIFQNILGKNEQIEIQNITNADQKHYYEYNGKLLVYSNGVMNEYNNKGEITHTYNFDTNFSPSIYINGTYMSVINSSNGTIYTFNKNSKIYEKSIKGTIQNVFLEKDGTISVVYITSGYKKIIDIIDKSGNTLKTVYLDSESVLKVNLYNSNTKMAVIATDTSNLKIGSKIEIIDISLEVPNVIHSEKIESELVTESYMLNDDIILLTDSNIKKYNLSAQIIKNIASLQDSQTNFVSINEGYFCTISTVDGTYKFKTCLNDGNEIAETMLDELPKYINVNNVITCIVSENKVICVNKWGMKIKEIEVNLAPRQVIFFNNSRSIALVYSNKINIINL